MLKDIGFIACSDEVAFRDNHEPNSNEHTVLDLEIISGLNDELVDAVVRYHHSTLESNDCPTDLSSDILRCVNIALACNRLEELVYGPDPCPKQEALEAIQAETEEGVLASRGSRAPRRTAVKLAEAPSPLSLERPMAGRV